MSKIRISKMRIIVLNKTGIEFYVLLKMPVISDVVDIRIVVIGKISDESIRSKFGGSRRNGNGSGRGGSSAR